MATAAKKQTINEVTTNGSTNTAVQKDAAEKEKFSIYLQDPKIKDSLIRALGNEKAVTKFSKAMLLAVANNKDLAKCTYASIVSAALQGATLGLSPSSTIGHYYIVPYGKQAQFQMGWKGYYQLATTSGYYSEIDVSEVKQGELKSYNPITKQIEFEELSDEVSRENLPTIGYYAWFILKNGFKKHEYWSKEKMQKHAEKYSKGYQAKSGYSFWEKNFDVMAEKTMLRMLLSKYGVLSPELEMAMNVDMTAGDDISGQDRTYIDNENNVIDVSVRTAEE